MTWLQGIDYWHWWILGVFLVILEILSPGVFFLWMGVAAGLVGLLVMLQPGLDWEYQILAFAGLCILTVLGYRAYFRRHPIQTDRPLLNRRGAQYVGRLFTLEQPIVNGVGKLRVDDTTWKIIGEDCPVGTRVRVSGVESTVLKVVLEGSRPL